MKAGRVDHTYSRAFIQTESTAQAQADYFYSFNDIPLFFWWLLKLHSVPFDQVPFKMYISKLYFN